MNGTFRFQLGRLSCLAIMDNRPSYPVGMFLTNLPEGRYESLLHEQGHDTEDVALPYTCLLIDTGRERVLVDTGIGPAGVGPGPGRLVDLLRAEGMGPQEISTVILSHGHPDHIGGCLNPDGKPAFSNARYVMLRAEWDFWMSGPSLDEMPLDESFKTMMLAAAQRNLPGIQGQVDLLHPDTEIVPGITAIAAFGHSPAQMGVEISSEGERLLFVADAIILPLHLEYPELISVVDHQPSEMVATRIRLLEKAAREKCLVATSHFDFPGLGHVATKRERWEWRPIEASQRSSVKAGL
jgi:glyoxylase-like metal-dependent hydrolase (beta-lactamase superfamily II)